MDETQNTSPVLQEPQPAPAPAPMPAPVPAPVPAAPIAPSAPVAPAALPPSPQAPVVDLSGNKGMAILAYLGPLILVPFLTEAKNDPFVKFHLKQGLVLIITSIGFGILKSFIPGSLWTFNILLSFVSLGFLIIDIIGIINASTGKMAELPIIGGFAKSFNF